MIVLLAMALTQQGVDPPPLPYAPTMATEAGARSTVERLFAAVRVKDSAAFDRIARGVVIMVAPDFAVTLDRRTFEQTFAGCSAPQVVSARPLPTDANARAVRIEMTCVTEDRPQAAKVVADLIADDQHVMAVLPGGLEQVWPEGKAGLDRSDG